MAYLIDSNDIVSLEEANDMIEFETILKKKKIQSPSIISFVKDIYQFATSKMYTCGQKERLINHCLKFIAMLSKIDLQKFDFIENLKKQTHGLSLRGKDMIAAFTIQQTEDIYAFLKQELIPYFEIYESVTDYSPQFTIQSNLYAPVPTVNESSIDKGVVIEVDSIPILQQFIGIRQAKEEKKDPKKK